MPPPPRIPRPARVECRRYRGRVPNAHHRQPVSLLCESVRRILVPSHSSARPLGEKIRRTCVHACRSPATRPQRVLVAVWSLPILGDAFAVSSYRLSREARPTPAHGNRGTRRMSPVAAGLSFAWPCDSICRDAPVAQLDRARGCGPRGQRFKSSPAYQVFSSSIDFHLWSSLYPWGSPFLLHRSRVLAAGRSLARIRMGITRGINTWAQGAPGRHGSVGAGVIARGAARNPR